MNLTPLLLAAGLLTVFPAATHLKSGSFTESNRCSAIDWYGIVGLLMGVFIAACYLALCAVFPALVAAVMVLTIWVLLTGAMHLDGLADCSDAIAASHANRERYLEVMKTPTVGAMAVAVVCLQLLFKAALLTSLVSQGSAAYASIAIITAVVFSRIFAALYQNSTHYARERGMGLGVTKPVWRINMALLLLIFLVGAVFFNATFLLTALVCSGLLLVIWRSYWIKRISGYSGDCVGAYIELNETLLLTVSIAYLGTTA